MFAHWSAENFPFGLNSPKKNTPAEIKAKLKGGREKLYSFWQLRFSILSTLIFQHFPRRPQNFIGFYLVNSVVIDEPNFFRERQISRRSAFVHH